MTYAWTTYENTSIVNSLRKHIKSLSSKGKNFLRIFLEGTVQQTDLSDNRNDVVATTLLLEWTSDLKLSL